MTFSLDTWVMLTLSRSSFLSTVLNDRGLQDLLSEWDGKNNELLVAEMLKVFTNLKT